MEPRPHGIWREPIPRLILSLASKVRIPCQSPAAANEGVDVRVAMIWVHKLVSEAL